MHDFEESVSMRLVQKVAAYTGTEPMELPPLYDTIDPKSIDACVNKIASFDLSFRYAGVPITVESNGVIQLGEESSAATIWNTDDSTVQTAD